MKEDVKRTRGAAEEGRVYAAVSRVPGAIVYRNLYIPSAACGNTAEIDLLLASASGLWVIEVKSRAGCVVGSLSHYEWSQHYRPPGARAKKVTRFYSPVRQCARQQAVVSRWLGVPPEHIKGLVVFPALTKLKVPLHAENCTVLQTPFVASHLRRCLASGNACFTPDELSRLERRLDAIASPSDGMRRLHIIHARQAERARKGGQMRRRASRRKP